MYVHRMGQGSERLQRYENIKRPSSERLTQCKGTAKELGILTGHGSRHGTVRSCRNDDRLFWSKTSGRGRSYNEWVVSSS